MPHRIEPGPGQESVWDYPRPPRIELDERRVQVWLAGELIADTTRARRVLETSHPPGFYLPPDDVATRSLVATGATSTCEWKGEATYYDVVAGGDRSEAAAWTYFDPTPAFLEIAGFVAFYPRLVDCTVDGTAVKPQPGAFYGGWVTPEIVGPFKGEPGTEGW